MRSARGFTLLEIVIVLAVVGILATVAYGVSRSAQRNANLSSATFELALKLSGLKAQAISEQVDFLAVFLDGSAPESCGPVFQAGCSQYVILREPTAAWTLAAFDPTAIANASFVERVVLPRGARLHEGVAGTPPVPFAAIPMFEAEVTGTAGGKKRFALRFRRDGSVGIEKPDGTPVAKAGYAFALASGAAGDPAADRKGIVVAFPAGIVRTFPTF